MRKLLRSMKKERMKRVSRSVVTVSLAAGMMLGGAMLGAHNAAAFESHTTTVGMDVTMSTDSVGENTRIVNLGIMGLDELGNVDVNAEAGGSTIVASVSSVLGDVLVDPSTWSDGSRVDRPNPGTFAASTKYVSITQGDGSVAIQYPNSASGTDTITVTLYEVRTIYGGSYESREIASKTMNVAVNPVSAKAGVLGIVDIAGTQHATPGTDLEKGLAGGMQAGATGNTITVEAFNKTGDAGDYTQDTNYSGAVTLTFYDEKGTEYKTLSGYMDSGEAQIAIPSSFTKAGTYEVVATTDDGLTSRLQDADVTDPATADGRNFLTITSDVPKKLELSTDMTVVAANMDDASVGTANRAQVTVTLLDEYGNKTINPAAAPINVTLSDTKNIIYIPNGAAGQDATVTVPIMPGSATASFYAETANTTGTSVLTAKASGLTTSDPLSIKVVTDYIEATGSFSAAANKVGFQWNLFEETDGTTAHGIARRNVTAGTNDAFAGGERFLVKNVATDETSPESQAVDNSAGTTPAANLPVTFNKPATNAELQASGFIIKQVAEEVGSLRIAPAAANTAIAITADVAKAAKYFASNEKGEGYLLTSPIAYFPAGSSKAQLVLDLAQIRAFDGLGNMLTTDGEEGNVKVSSAKGTVSNTGYVNYGAGGTTLTIDYPADASGSDTLTFTFDKTSIADFNDGQSITVQLPAAVADAAGYMVTPEQDTFTVPVNGILPIDIYPVDSDGNVITDREGFTLEMEGGFQAYVPKNTALPGKLVGNGSNSGTNVGRYALRIVAGGEAGTFPLTVKSIADPSISKTVNIEVKKYTVPLSLGNTAITVAPGSSGTVEIIGGTGPYTAQSADENVVTASVDGSSLKLTAVNEGGPVDVTVTDALNATATVGVTVAQSGVVPDLGPSYGMDANGNSISSNTSFSGGVSVAGGSYSSSATVSEGDQVNIQLNMSIDSADQGKAADMIALVGYKPEGGVLSWYIKPASDSENWVQWYGDLAELTPYKTVTGLNASETVDVFSGALTGLGGGTVQAYAAYRLPDGTLVWNQQPVIINVTH